MRAFLTLLLLTIVSTTFAARLGKCQGWSVAPLTHSVGGKSTFRANDEVTLKWNVGISQVKYIREVTLSSAKSNQPLHTQLRSYPGIKASNGKITFKLSVPLCLQREGEYFLNVVASTPGKEGDCLATTPSFRLTPEPNKDYSVCK
ncbi:hypothetical protein K493DRAFT_297956 [Basidiobolus meristosporus CBS 931.73]|uniref:Ser-Thr-rich glycosyl-phosphatidyl-inositol-anchored membrane family-domain-containing protein n=1 Tax=Basidiobolus meristosporus CBS 931.73 TaxID=1314790 RepID=A0A1Y1YW65_9FUNG|nr:hypothetical protein K493DRAFT_297956 [Basidiobolus meristosporus CBS 931.73]|eukprot:ORY02313.1 hypothetical protein K493DRAFT_297956 [Basidiobolus meristosporus CBS 931.73]